LRTAWRAGADVVPSSRRAEQVKAVAAEIRALGRRSLEAVSDVSDRASLDQLLEKCIGEFGKVDILVNSAGKTKRTPTVDVSDEEWTDILDTNVNGTLRACQIFGRHMLENSYGRIVNIASLTSFVALYEVAAYSASKAAVAMLTKSLAIEWAAHGVNVNAIAPGVFRTALNEKLLDGTGRGREFLLRTPMKRFGKVEELAGAAVFLASEAASFVTGKSLWLMVGFSPAASVSKFVTQTVSLRWDQWHSTRSQTNSLRYEKTMSTATLESVVGRGAARLSLSLEELRAIVTEALADIGPGERVLAIVPDKTRDDNTDHLVPFAAEILAQKQIAHFDAVIAQGTHGR
jgi:NAD(P)-dependent dehydrogenase (short-subunit alcohol dehydrogenase family)